MTAPYPFYDNTTYLIGRRVEEGRFQLKPTEELVNVFMYLAYLYAARHDILILTCCIMSNHYHMVVLDKFGNIASFQRDFHSRLREAVIAMCGVPGQKRLWEPERTGRTRLEDADAIRRMTLYAAANPVQAGIVRSARDWSGLVIDPSMAGRTLVAHRPKELDHYISFPDTTSHTVAATAAFAQGGLSGSNFASALAKREAVIGGEREDKFTGAAVALALPTETLPKTPLEHSPNPLFATKNHERRKQVRAELRLFRREHRRAHIKAACPGIEVIWPAGTYKQHKILGHPRHPS